jgi:hypothetical protein
MGIRWVMGIRSSGMMVAFRVLAWKFDARKRKKYFSLDFESDKNGQSKRTGYL